MRKISIIMLFTILFANIAQAGEIDKLVQHLMKEGVIKPADAQLILTETKEENRVKMAQGKLDTLPSWIQKMKIGADLRYRFQREDKGTYTRDRQRIRFRVKGEGKPSQGYKIAWRLCTGGADPRSTNQTLEDGFATRAINLDYAYAGITKIKGLNLMMGKIPVKSAIKRYEDLLWDGDIAVDGITAKYTGPKRNLQFWANINYLVMEHVKNGGDPTLAVIQPGITYKSGKTKLSLAITQYGFSGLKGSSTGGFVAAAYAGGNSTTGGNYMYDYSSTAIGYELSFNKGMLYFPKVALFGEYISNPDADAENTGMLVGVKFGAKKVKSCGQWQAKLMSRYMEKDGWADWLGDSDTRGGKTDNEGIEATLDYGIAKNVVFGLDYYSIGQKSTGGDKLALLQVDMKYKF